MIAQKISVRTGTILFLFLIVIIIIRRMTEYSPVNTDVVIKVLPSCLVSIVTIIGGIVFLAFALSALFIKPDAGL